MRKSEPPGFWPRLGYLAFSFASSARSGMTVSFSCESCKTAVDVRASAPRETKRTEGTGVPQPPHGPVHTRPEGGSRRCGYSARTGAAQSPGPATPASHKPQHLSRKSRLRARTAANERLKQRRQEPTGERSREEWRAAEPTGSGRARHAVPHLFLLPGVLRAGAGTQRGGHGGERRPCGSALPPRSLRVDRPCALLQNGRHRPLTPRLRDGQVPTQWAQEEAVVTSRTTNEGPRRAGERAGFGRPG